MARNSLAGVDDMINLQDLHEGSLLFNLALRYQNNTIYTFTVRCCAPRRRPLPLVPHLRPHPHPPTV